MRRRLLLLVPVLLAAAVLPAAAGPRPVARSVAPGYDLFVTPDGSQLAVDAAVAGVPVMTFRGAPLRAFDFEGVGTRGVGPADTIVRRLGTATPASPRVDVELVGLLLESTNVRGYFVTLQSARPLGLPSTGTVEFTFDRNGVGGLMRSDLTVNYDVRYGAPDGPIVGTGSTGMGFVAEDLLWSRSAPAEDGPEALCVAIDNPSVTSTGQWYCADTNTLCHSAGGVANHLHCVRPDTLIPIITGVNHRLNGVDTSADFHPVGTATRRR